MGYDRDRFRDLNEELICCICSGVLDDPVELRCRHIFCNECMQSWLSKSKPGTCPHCRARVRQSDIRPVVPMLKNIIGKQYISCDNRDRGCTEIPHLENLKKHLSRCLYGLVTCENEDCTASLIRKDAKKHMDESCPQRKVKCDKGCDMEMPFVKLEIHNCIIALKSHFAKITNDLQKQISTLEKKVGELSKARKQDSSDDTRSNSRKRFRNIPGSEENQTRHDQSGWHNPNPPVSTRRDPGSSNNATFFEGSRNQEDQGHTIELHVDEVSTSPSYVMQYSDEESEEDYHYLDNYTEQDFQDDPWFQEADPWDDCW